MQEKKKILFFITKGNFGGAQRYVYNLATSLPPDKFEVVVAVGNKEGTILIEKLKEKNIKTTIIESAQREINLKNDLKVFRELIKIIENEKPNVIHLNSSKIGLLGSLAILYLRVLNLFSFLTRTSYFVPRSIFTSHGWAFNEQNRSLFSKIIFYFGHYLTVLICDQTIAVSEKTKKDIAWLPFLENKIKVVYNGVEKFETLKKEDISGILKKEKNQLIIFTTAELHHNKGLDVALRGIALMPQKIKERIVYYIAGEGEERTNLEKLVNFLNLKKIVYFLGYFEEARGLLPGADIFLFPSRTENLPFSLLEAGQIGLPIIATSVGGIPEIIKDMKNGILIHPKNPKEVAEALIYLIEKEAKQKEFGEEIKKTIQNFFTLQKMIEETISIYS